VSRIIRATDNGNIGDNWSY